MLYYKAADPKGYNNSDEFLANFWLETKSLKYPILLVYIVIFVLPLSLLKDFTRFSKFYWIGICSMFYSMMVFVVECPFFLSDFLRKGGEVNWFDASVGFTSDVHFFKAVGIVYYTYNCQVGAIPIYKKLHNNTRRRVLKVFNRGVWLDVIIFLSLGTAGFLTVPEGLKSLILIRPNNGVLQTDIFLSIGISLSVFNLSMAVIAQYIALRFILFSKLFDTQEIDDSRF